MSRSKVTVLLFLIFLTEFTIHANSYERQHDVQFLVDLIGQMGHSNKVLTHLCWKRGSLQFKIMFQRGNFFKFYMTI